MVKIALDYDMTYSLAPEFWDEVIATATMHGHDVRIVTTRSPRDDNIDHIIDHVPIIYCDGVAKKYFCTWFANDFKGWIPDVWIDDKPESILENSSGTRESLAEWRATREH